MREPIPPSVSRRLDALRAAAAVGVVVAHVRGLFFVPFSQVSHPNPLLRAFYAATALGHQWVMVFFVLSGYLISRSVVISLSEQRWEWRRYLIQRLSRLWIVLIPAIVIGGLLDMAGSRLFGDVSPYHGLPAYAYILPFSAAHRLGGIVLFGNIGFLQGIKVPTYGTNGPLWSLPYEFWFYLLFPLMLLSFHRTTTRGRRLATIVILIAVMAFVGKLILIYFLVWLLGVAVLRLPVCTLTTKRRQLGVAVAALCWLGIFALSAADRSLLTPTAADFVIALSFSIFLYALTNLRSADPGAQGPKGPSRLSLIAGFSYTLYLVHFPLLVFIKSAVSPVRPSWQPNLLTLFGASGLVGLTLVYAWAVSLVTEARTGDLRHLLLGLVATSKRER